MNSPTLIQGDCLEVMRALPDGCVDMVLTDPPYGMSLKPQRRSGPFAGKTIKNDDNLDWCDKFFKQCFRLLPADSCGVFFCLHHCMGEFLMAGKGAGFEIKNVIIWDKGHFGMGGNWRPCHEFAIIMTKGRFVTKSNNLKTIIPFKRTHHSKAVHPTQKPVDLIEHILYEPDYDPQTILDPFMGSGTTGVACKNLNRNFIGIELDADYFNIAKQRITEA